MKKVRDFLLTKIQTSRPEAIFVAMPDFFLDHLVRFSGSIDELLSKLKAVYERGGGNIVNVSQGYTIGGNAANFSVMLSNLGARVLLICKTDEFGYKALTHFAPNLDVSHVKRDGKISTSSIIEVGEERFKANLMISDPGDVREFGFECLTDDDVEAIRNADYICVFNWTQNLKGNELAKKVFELGKRGKAKTFLDLGDPSWRLNEIPSFLVSLCKDRLLDVLGMNENEVRQVARAFKLQGESDPLSSAKLLSEKLDLRIALHTPSFAADIKGKDVCQIPAFRLKPVRVTGAGDAWNAGFLFGDSVGLDGGERLLLANATAAAHILKPPGSFVRLSDVKSVIREKSLLTL